MAGTGRNSRGERGLDKSRLSTSTMAFLGGNWTLALLDWLFCLLFGVGWIPRTIFPLYVMSVVYCCMSCIAYWDRDRSIKQWTDPVVPLSTSISRRRRPRTGYLYFVLHMVCSLIVIAACNAIGSRDLSRPTRPGKLAALIAPADTKYVIPAFNLRQPPANVTRHNPTLQRSTQSFS